MITCKEYDQAIIEARKELDFAKYDKLLDYKEVSDKAIEVATKLLHISLKFQGQEEI